MNRPPLGTVVIVVALIAGSVVGGSSGGVGRAPASRLVEVIGATAVCPDLRQQAGFLATRVSVGADPLPVGRGGVAGFVEAVHVSAKGGRRQQNSVPVGVRSPGEVAVGLGTRTTGDGLQVTATGELGEGLEVEQITRGERGADRGLAGLRCDAPRRDSWFVGGGTHVGEVSTLVLANVDDTPSTVDVRMFGNTGPTDNRIGQGLTLPPHSRQLISLDTLGPDRGLLAVHVQSRRGRVAAGLRYSRVNGALSLGVDWIPRAQEPASTVVVPGFPQGPGARGLIITNPSQDPTEVSVRVTTVDGQFVPTKLNAIGVPAGTSILVSLSGQTDASALAATVTSLGAPVLAGGFVSDRLNTGVFDIAFTAGSAPLSGPALLTDLVIDRPTESTLVLSALDGPARVLMTPIRVLGTSGALPAPKLVRIAAGRTATLRLSTFYPPGTRTRLAVEVRPLAGSGPVYAARYLRERGAHGPLTTLLDLQGPAQLVSRPEVYRDPRLGS